MIRRTATAQAQTNGYFGGYIGKRQRAGKLETKKCVDKMHVLRNKNEGKSEFEQQRAVSGRMITDIETNGTLRGAVEQYNLTTNLRANDVLFAECIRTFATVMVNAQAWLHRLELELQKVVEMKVDTPVPRTKAPNRRSIHSKAPWVDLYGFRPLGGKRFPLLSPFEFLMYWEGEALTAPKRGDANPKTEWTAQGNEARRSVEGRAGNIKYRPGVHYTVVEPNVEVDEYYTYPTEPKEIYEVFPFVF